MKKQDIFLLVVVIIVVILIVYLLQNGVLSVFQVLVGALLAIFTAIMYKKYRRQRDNRGSVAAKKADGKADVVKESLDNKSADELIREINAESHGKPTPGEDDIEISNKLKSIMGMSVNKPTDGLTGGLEDGTIFDTRLGYDNDMIYDANASGSYVNMAGNTMTPEEIRKQLLSESVLLQGPLSANFRNEGTIPLPDTDSDQYMDTTDGQVEGLSSREILADIDPVYPNLYGPAPDYKPPLEVDSQIYKQYLSGIKAAATKNIADKEQKTRSQSQSLSTPSTDYSTDFWDKKVDLRSIQANMGGSGDNQIFNRMKYLGMQARVASDIRASMNRYSFQPYFDEELNIKENQIWWENDALEQVF
jgi:Ca2+/Na+ antiporter